jgi:hypothetical protein
MITFETRNLTGVPIAIGQHENREYPTDTLLTKAKGRQINLAS